MQCRRISGTTQDFPGFEIKDVELHLDFGLRGDFQEDLWWHRRDGICVDDRKDEHCFPLRQQCRLAILEGYSFKWEGSLRLAA